MAFITKESCALVYRQHLMKDTRWHPYGNLLNCQVASSCIDMNSCEGLDINFFKNVKLQRREDVLMATAWLAPIVWNQGYNRDILNKQFHQIDFRVGLTIFAIKKYVRFVEKFIGTAEKFFMLGHKVNYYIFTDCPNDITNLTMPDGREIVILVVPAYERWQDVTMRRMEMIRDFASKKFISEVDYLWCVDVDMVFLDEVGVEILSNIFATLHPGFFGSTRVQFPYERRPESAAYIPSELGDFYYAGGSFGGVLEEVIRLTNFCHNAMLEDKKKNIEALWHDESYLNKYFLFHKPTKVLSPEYIWINYFRSTAAIQTKRFISVDKNYKEVRFKRAVGKLKNF
ncbi:histo-blood group ABO system transferase-like [Gastrophryne carolinensis]